MYRKFLAVLISFAFGVTLATAADSPVSTTQLSAAEIAKRNVEARGGLQAWRAVQTMTLSGSMGVGGNRRAALAVPPPTGHKLAMQGLPAVRPEKEVALPFVMELARPHKERFELKFKGQTAIQVYDGTSGWKLRPFLNRLDAEPFTPEEMKIASSQPDLDGPLVDYAAKGIKIELVGREKVEGHDAYKVKLTTKDGNSKNVWIDAQTFLEAKMDGQPRLLDGTYHPVEVYFRDYRQVDGLLIPFVFETKVLPVAKTATGLRDTPVPVESITVEKVVLNPKFDESLFAKPQVVAAAATKPALPKSK